MANWPGKEAPAKRKERDASPQDATQRTTRGDSKIIMMDESDLKKIYHLQDSSR